MKRITPLAALLMVGALAGCGSDGGATTTATTTTTSVATATVSPTSDTATSTSSAPATSTGAETTTGTASTPGVYTMADVAKHNSEQSCWTAIDGKVYDVTSWISQHPGGPERIKGLCGIDGTQAFHGQHDGEGGPNGRLASFQIGTLAG